MSDTVALTGIIVVGLVIGVVAIVGIVFGVAVRSKANQRGFELHVDSPQGAPDPPVGRVNAPKRK